MIEDLCIWMRIYMQKYVYVNTCAFCSQAWFSAEVTTHLLFWSYVSSLEFKEIAASLRSKDQNTEAMQTLDLFQNQVSPGKKKSTPTFHYTAWFFSGSWNVYFMDYYNPHCSSGMIHPNPSFSHLGKVPNGCHRPGVHRAIISVGIRQLFRLPPSHSSSGNTNPTVPTLKKNLTWHTFSHMRNLTTIFSRLPFLSGKKCNFIFWGGNLTSHLLVGG